MFKNYDIFNKTQIFANMNSDEINSTLKFLNAKEKKYMKNSFILNSGTTINSIGLLISGNILIVQEDFWGNRNILAQISPADIFAESFACSPGSVLSISAVAKTDCNVLWLDIQQLISTNNICIRHEKMIQNLLSVLAAKNIRINEKQTHMSKRTTRDKLLSYLSSQAKKNNTSEFEIPFDRQQLADYLCVDRSAMSSELCKLRDNGMLEFSKNHFKLIL